LRPFEPPTGGLRESRGEPLRGILDRLAFVELHPTVLQRALGPFPTPVRTLDGLHLASACSLRGQGQHVCVATYDWRVEVATAALDFELYRL
jgi:hypothetical protein